MCDNLPQKEIDEYRSKFDPIQKQYVCQFWLRGLCCFPKEICHNAHGCSDLVYHLENNHTLQPDLPEEARKLKHFVKMPRKYYSLLEQQKDPLIQQQVQKYYESMGQKYDQNFYDLNGLQQNKKITSIILTFTLLNDLADFYRLIASKIGVVPKVILINELNRVGYSFMGEIIFYQGSQQMKPGTVIYHLISAGVCFQRKVESKAIEITGKVCEHKTTRHSGEKKNNKQQEDEEQEEEEEILSTKSESNFIVPIHDLQKVNAEMMNQLMIIFKEKNDQLMLVKDYDDFQMIVDEELNRYNDQSETILPYFDQFLRLNNWIWEEFKEKYNIPYAFANATESGITIQRITQNFNQGQIDALNEYLALPKHKYFFCQYWLRGICIFQNQHCQFAHGFENLQIGALVQPEEMIKLQKPLRYNQKPLISHRTYRVLFMKQKEFNNPIKRTQFEIDNVREYRELIRKQILEDITIKVYNKFIGGKQCTKTHLVKLFESVGLFQPGVDLNETKVLKILQVNKLTYEKEVEEEGKKVKVSYMIPALELQTIKEAYLNMFTQILIKEINEQQIIPISESDVRKNLKQFDTNMALPGFYKFLRMDKQYSIMQFFKSLLFPIVKPSLFGQIPQEIYDQISEDCSNLIEFNEDLEQINIYIKSMIADEKKSIINLTKLETKLTIQFQKKISALQNKDKLVELIQGHFKNQPILTAYGQSKYVVNNQPAVHKLKTCACGKSLNWPAIPKQINEEQLIQMMNSIRSFVDPDVRNTIIVDSELKLQIVQEVLHACSQIGVDIEGQLNRGNIWLIQLGICIRNERLVIIFDLMKAKYLDQDIVLHTQMLSVLQSVMEDQSILKVFHDGKKDSLALHINGICPKNVADTSITYCLIEYLKQNSNQKVIKVLSPGINEVLRKYNADHGENELKEYMHGQFGTTIEYFLQRPHQEFMYYSARDVEDLVQVYNTMEQEFSKTCNKQIIYKLSRKNLESKIEPQPINIE